MGTIFNFPMDERRTGSASLDGNIEPVQDDASKIERKWLELAALTNQLQKIMEYLQREVDSSTDTSLSDKQS